MRNNMLQKHLSIRTCDDQFIVSNNLPPISKDLFIIFFTPLTLFEHMQTRLLFKDYKWS